MTRVRRRRKSQDGGEDDDDDDMMPAEGDGDTSWGAVA